MGSSTLMLFLFYSLFLQILVTTAQQPTPIYSICSEGGNFTSNSTYQKNLEQALTSLSSNTEINYGFYNTSFGRNPNKVSALSLCRGDKTANACLACINNSTQEIRQSCPNQKEAIIWYDDCMLRYSNRSILGTMEFEPSVFLYNVNNVSNVAQFDGMVKSLLDNLTTEAASGNSLRKFATGNTSATNNQTIYGLVQCTPDLSKQQCFDCMRNATDSLSQCCSGKQGGRVLGTSCQLRYENYVFYDSIAQRSDTPSPSAAPAPTPVSGPTPSAAPAPTPVSETTPSPAPTPVLETTPPASPPTMPGPEPGAPTVPGTTPSPNSSPPPPPISSATMAGMASTIVQAAIRGVLPALILNKF